MNSESIVTKGFLVNFDLMMSSFPRWFIALTLGCFGLMAAAQWTINLSFTPFLSKPIEFNLVRNPIRNLIYFSRSMIVIFGLDWKAFAKYTKQLSQIELEKHEKSVKQIDRERKVKNWFCFVSLTSYAVISNILFFIPKEDIEFQQIFSLLLDMALLIGNVFLIHIILDLCICLKAAFQFINQQLAHFQGTSSPHQMLISLRSNRLLYSCAVRASQDAEKFVRHYIAWFYFQYILFAIIDIVDILCPKSETSVTFVFFMVLDIINLAYITVKLVAVNKVSTEGMEDLYEISYELKSYNLQNENNLFLNRMLWQNVGFTFSNLFLINPNFITSLISFSLTIALTMVNFLYK